MRTSFTRRVQDPIDLELTEVAQNGLNSSQASSREQLHDESADNMFRYGSAEDDDDDQERSASMSDRFNEENMIDILANVDTEAIDEHMVTHEEDNLAKTIAGVAGNVLEW